MFKKPGKKLRHLVILIFIVVLLAFLFAGMAITNAAGGSTPPQLAIIIIVLGVVVAWACSILLYAIGAAVEDINDIRNIVLDIYEEQHEKNVSGAIPVYYDNKN